MANLSQWIEARDTLDVRVRAVETRFAWLIGYMMGSGLVGGAAGAIISKLMG
jgi:hypothetical protein